MNRLINDIGWMMHGNPPNIYEAYTTNQKYDDDYKETLLTESQLNTVLHPRDDWLLAMEFDARSVNDTMIKQFSAPTDTEDSYFLITVIRCLKFDKQSTVRDVLQKISEGRCYGYLEGFEDLQHASGRLFRYASSTAEDKNIAIQNIYCLAWGT